MKWVFEACSVPFGHSDGSPPLCDSVIVRSNSVPVYKNSPRGCSHPRITIQTLTTPKPAHLHAKTTDKPKPHRGAIAAVHTQPRSRAGDSPSAWLVRTPMAACSGCVACLKCGGSLATRRRASPPNIMGPVDLCDSCTRWAVVWSVEHVLVDMTSMSLGIV